MAVSCPGLPPKILTDDVVKPTPGHTRRMAADGCHLAACSLYVLLVIIVFFFRCARSSSSRESSCIRQDQRSCQELFRKNFSRTYRSRCLRLLKRGVELPARHVFLWIVMRGPGWCGLPARTHNSVAFAPSGKLTIDLVIRSIR